MSKPPKKLRGRPAFDDRGNAIWKFSGRSETEVETGCVRALADGLSLEAPPKEKPTLDPYNQSTSQVEEKSRRRSLDDMRRLDEELRRQHEKLVRELRTGPLKPRATGSRLRLRFDDRELLVDERRSSILVGRGEDNDVVVTGERVSRLHACIEISDNQLVLIDMSANGTFVQPTSGEVSRVRRSSAVLKGQGMIGFGHKPEQGSSHTIHFTCEEA